MDPVRLEFELDADTAVAAAVEWNLTANGATPAVRSMRRGNAGWAMAVAGVFVGQYLAGAPAGVFVAQGVALCLAVAYVNLAGRGSRQASRQVLRAMYRDPAGAAALGRRTVEFTPSKLIVSTKYSREEYNWSAVLRVKVTPDFLLLTLPGPRPLAVPRSAVPGDFDQLADELRTAIAATA